MAYMNPSAMYYLMMVDIENIKRQNQVNEQVNTDNSTLTMYRNPVYQAPNKFQKLVSSVTRQSIRQYPYT